MSVVSLLLDEYDHRARLRPALLVSLPLALAAMGWFPDLSRMQVLAGVLFYCGFTTLLAQLGRDQGKKKEPWLFERWGGKPTTQLLRHRDGHLDSTTKTRYHAALKSVVHGMTLPSEQQEQDDPSSADVQYDSCVLFLREKTYDKKAFPLVFAENVNYGFRRNLWGMKTPGLGLSVLALLSSVVATIIQRNDVGRLPALASAGTVVSGLMLAWWCFRIKVNWVRVAAFAYAERLLSACDTLRPPSPPDQQRIIQP